MCAGDEAQVYYQDDRYITIVVKRGGDFTTRTGGSCTAQEADGNFELWLFNRENKNWVNYDNNSSLGSFETNEWHIYFTTDGQIMNAYLDRSASGVQNNKTFFFKVYEPVLVDLDIVNNFGMTGTTYSVQNEFDQANCSGHMVWTSTYDSGTSNTYNWD